MTPAFSAEKAGVICARGYSIDSLSLICDSVGWQKQSLSCPKRAQNAMEGNMKVKCFGQNLNMIPRKDDLGSVIEFAVYLTKGPRGAGATVRAFVNGISVPKKDYGRVIKDNDRVRINEISR